MFYLRASPIPRALESLQQTFLGMYPDHARTLSFPAPTIITRSPADETLYPNDANCRRFAQLSRAFAQRAADRWNDSSDVDYLNSLIGKWMPETSKRVAVDSRPRLSGIMDTINSTLAHGPETRLPKEFYDEKGREIIDKIGVEEWFAGYGESREYRALGIGALMGDVVERLVGSVEKGGDDGLIEVAGKDGSSGGPGRGGEKAIKFALSGCHDTSLAGVLASLGAFEGEKWPPYTSHIAVELFKQKGTAGRLLPGNEGSEPGASGLSTSEQTEPKGFFQRLFGSWTGNGKGEGVRDVVPGIRRKPLEDLDNTDKSLLDGYYVRIRYNDSVMTVPGCNLQESISKEMRRFAHCEFLQCNRHVSCDINTESQSAFKAIVDKYTPKNWKTECRSNLDRSAFPEAIEPAGY